MLTRVKSFGAFADDGAKVCESFVLTAEQATDWKEVEVVLGGVVQSNWYIANRVGFLSGFCGYGVKCFRKPDPLAHPLHRRTDRAGEWTKHKGWTQKCERKVNKEPDTLREFRLFFLIQFCWIWINVARLYLPAFNLTDNSCWLKSAKCFSVNALLFVLLLLSNEMKCS